MYEKDKIAYAILLHWEVRYDSAYMGQTFPAQRDNIKTSENTWEFFTHSSVFHTNEYIFTLF